MKRNICFVACLLLIGACENNLARETAPKTAATANSRFVDGDGFRELVIDDTPIWRDMIKYDPADRENTYKPYKHVYGFNKDAGFITKGAGGTHPHHRGVFLGFKTQFGDFWHCKDVTQRHVKYLDDRQLLAQDVARNTQVIEWVAKDDKAVVRETREVTTRMLSPSDILMDFHVTLESLVDEPVNLGGDAHHAGFHFRAAQEVSGETKSNNAGLATYVYPGGATALKNDIWENCDWTHMTFPVGGKTYALTHLDAPTNPRPIQYSTRPYGRVGSFFTGELTKETPLKLRYRLRLRDGAQPIRPEQLAAEYKQYATRLAAAK